MFGVALIAAAAGLTFAPQKTYAECVPDPESYLAMSFQEFDQGVQPVADGPRKEWGWREIAKQEGCDTAVADLISQWRERHGASLSPPKGASAPSTRASSAPRPATMRVRSR